MAFRWTISLPAWVLPGSPSAAINCRPRGGGFFYDRVPGNTIVHAIKQSPPYSETLDQGPATNQFSSEAAPFQNTPLGSFPTRWLNFANNSGSDLVQPFMVDNLVTPLVYSWNFNAQYQLARPGCLKWAMSALAGFI